MWLMIPELLPDNSIRRMSSKPPPKWESYTGNTRLVVRPKTLGHVNSKRTRGFARLSFEHSEEVDGVREAHIVVANLSSDKALQLGKWLIERYAPWAASLTKGDVENESE